MNKNKRRKRAIKYEFRDAQQMAKDYPETFEAPPISHIEALRQGDHVKVCSHGERFWVMVIDNDVTNQRIVGSAANLLLFSSDHGVGLGDVIEVEYRHVYDTELASEHPDTREHKPEQAN